MRILSKVFMNDLKTGMLKGLLDAMRRDQALDFQIRNNQVHIYYKGGRILDLKPKSSKGYYANFDENYCALKKHTKEDLEKRVHLQRLPKLPRHINTRDDADKWEAVFGQLKKIMDVWFVDHPKIERMHQQLVVDQNNKLPKSDKTDFFIIDIEYTSKLDRFDMIAMSWPTDSPEADPRLSFIEFKVGDNALRSASIKTGEDKTRTIPGIAKHLDDFIRFITPDNYLRVKDEMFFLLKQKLELDLLSHTEKLDRIRALDKFSDEAPRFIFLLANHNPKSTILLDELQNISDPERCELKIALVKYKQYGLFHKSMLNLSVAKEEISRRLQSAGKNKA